MIQQLPNWWPFYRPTPSITTAAVVTTIMAAVVEEPRQPHCSWRPIQLIQVPTRNRTTWRPPSWRSWISPIPWISVAIRTIQSFPWTSLRHRLLEQLERIKELIHHPWHPLPLALTMPGPRQAWYRLREVVGTQVSILMTFRGLPQNWSTRRPKRFMTRLKRPPKWVCHYWPLHCMAWHDWYFEFFLIFQVHELCVLIVNCTIKFNCMSLVVDNLKSQSVKVLIVGHKPDGKDFVDTKQTRWWVVPLVHVLSKYKELFWYKKSITLTIKKLVGEPVTQLTCCSKCSFNLQCPLDRHCLCVSLSISAITLIHQCLARWYTSSYLMSQSRKRDAHSNNSLLLVSLMINFWWK